MMRILEFFNPKLEILQNFVEKLMGMYILSLDGLENTTIFFIGG